MNLFSQRIGIKPIKNMIQKDFIDNDLKNSLWNCLTFFYWNLFEKDQIDANDFQKSALLKKIWMNFFKNRIDKMPYFFSEYKKFVEKFFFSAQWYEIYDFIEFVQDSYYDQDYPDHNKEFNDFCNNALQKELSAYRFVNGVITEITSETEIESIEESINNSDEFIPVTIHINRALELLSEKQNPDYRNSIKESISAVEALCSIITNNPKTTLGQALNEIEKNNSVHPALKKSFSILYGYTSDSDGIRHALLEQSVLKQEDAKFMLVACSAFINYLKQKI